MVSPTKPTDGRLVLSDDGDEIFLCDRSENKIYRWPLFGQSPGAISPDGRFWAGPGQLKGTYCLDLRELSTPTKSTVGKWKDLDAVVESVGFSADGRWLLAGTTNSRLQVVDLRDRNVVLSLSTPFYRAAISPDGRTIATINHANPVQLWNRPTGRSLLSLPGGTLDQVSSVTFSPDGRGLLVEG
ncbi:MAG: WD40 repeat domain-containing protein, partial [Planctomycetia bacterium]